MATVASACLLATACGGGTQQDLTDAPVLIGWDGQPVTSDTETTVPVAAPETTVLPTPAKMLRAPRPVSLPFIDVDASIGPGDETPSDLPRTTAAGIRIESSSEPFDFGDGAQDAVLLSASGSTGRVGLYLDPEELVSDAMVTDTIAWASSGGVVMVIFEVGPTVALVTLESVDGNVDQVQPSPDQIAILAVPGDGTAGVSATAFDDAGTVAATCAPEGEFGFINCTPLG